MQVTVRIEDEAVAQKVLWMLERFENDGVEIVQLDDDDDMIINSFKEGLKEVQLIKKGELSARPVQEFLDEL